MTKIDFFILLVFETVLFVKMLVKKLTPKIIIPTIDTIINLKNSNIYLISLLVYIGFDAAKIVIISHFPFYYSWIEKELLFWLGEQARKPEACLLHVEDFRSEVQQRQNAIIFQIFTYP